MFLGALKNSWALFAGLAFLMMGYGLQSSLLGLRAAIEGFSTQATGIVMGCYFIGFLLSSLITPKILGRVGHIRVFAAFASLASTSSLLHAVIIDSFSWSLMRLVTGFCYAGLYIVAESWLNSTVDNENRGKLLSIYMVVVYSFIALGQLMINLADLSGVVLFLITSITVSVSLIPISLARTCAPCFEAPTPVGIRKLYSIAPLGFVSSFGVGVTQGAIFGMAAVYANNLGMEVKEISLFLAAITVGSILLHWPIGKISDTLDRRLVLVVSTLLAGLTAIAAALLAGPKATPGFLIASFLFGALCAPIYSLSIAHTNDHLEPHEIVTASSTLILVYASGSITGPFVIAFLLEHLGNDAFFYFMALALFGLCLFGLYSMRRREAVPVEEQGSCVAVPAEATPMVVGMTPEGEQWVEENIASQEKASAAE